MNNSIHARLLASGLIFVLGFSFRKRCAAYFRHVFVGGARSYPTIFWWVSLVISVFASSVTAQGYDTTPRPCFDDNSRYCSRCENTTSLWLSPGPKDPKDGIADPSWITFPQLWDSPGPNSVRPPGLPASFKQGNIVTSIGTQSFPQNMYHYFELLVKGGDNLQAADSRRDLVYYSLVSPDSMQVSKGQIVPSTQNSAKKPAYDFYVGQDCIPTEGNWNNQGYGNLDANENMKSIVVNVTRDARYFIALQSRSIRYGVSAYDFTMKLSRGALNAKYPQTRCYPLVYRFPNEIYDMMNQYSQTQQISSVPGGSVPPCGQTPFELKYNVQYVYPPPKGGLTQREIAIVVGAAGGSVVLVSLVTGLWLWRRYKRTTARMAKFSSLSRGLPDALLDGEGQEVAV